MQENKREERRKANQERIVAMICSQHPDITPEQALEIIQRGISPQEFREEARLKRVKEFQESRARKSRGFQRGGGKGARPAKGKKKWDKKRVSKKKLMRKQAIDDILARYPDLKDRAVAGQIASERLTYEQWVGNQSKPKARRRRPSHRSEEEHTHAQELREERLKALQERVERESHLGNKGDAYFEEKIEKEVPLQVMRFHKQGFSGILTKAEPFRLFMKTETNPSMVLTKRFCSAVFVESEQERVLSQCQVSLMQRAQHQIPHHEPSMRFQIPEDVLKEGRPLWIMLHDGIQIEGSLLWSDRFQLLVSLPNESEIFVFRHAVYRAATEAPELEGEFVPLLDFDENSLELPNVHPKELSLDDVYIPTQFNDYSVKDVIFDKYVEAFDKGDFNFDPLYVRREGDSYVLVDGYRRWILAKEKGVETIPIIVM